MPGKPVIVGLDPLRPDRAPLVLGAGLARLTGVARLTGAPLVLVASHLHDALTNAVSGGWVERDLRERAAQVLDEVAAGIEAERVVAAGFSASHALHDVAVERDAGLLVVGSSRRGKIGRIALGTTGERLLHGAACPVAVAPSGLADGWAPERVGVGFVDLEEGRHALAAAASLARLAHAPLEAVTAVAPLTWGHGAAVAPHDAGARPEAARAAAAAALGRALERAGRDADEGRVFTGEAVDALIGLSDRVDLVVCGSRGYGPLQSVLLGGVSHGLLRHARCPVVVIPRGAGDAIDRLTARGSSIAS